MFSYHILNNNYRNNIYFSIFRNKIVKTTFKNVPDRDTSLKHRFNKIFFLRYFLFLEIRETILSNIEKHFANIE